jgi:hypothetical protein
MKKILTFTLAILLLAAGVYASNWCKHKVTIATSATATAITAQPGYLFNVIAAGDQATTGTINIYDYATNIAAVTTTEIEMIPTVSMTTAEVLWYAQIPLNPPARFYYGLYLVITSTSEVALYWLNDNDI